MENRSEPKKMDKEYLETAIILSRMYGVAETLHSMEYPGDKKFIRKIREWTKEFLGMENADILKFFEAKMSK